jgi:proline racemase
VGSRFRAVVEDKVIVDGVEAVIPVVTGTAFPTGEHVFLADAEDELAAGFLLQ